MLEGGKLKPGDVRLGHKRTYAAQQGMSALPPKADICSALAHVRFGPKVDILSFDHFVGGKLRWNRQTERLSQIYLAGLINLRLLFDLSHRPELRDPWLRGARPYLHTRGDLIALTNCACSNGVSLGSCPDCRRINWRSTFRAERLWPFIPAFAGLDVDFQFARKQLESIFAGVRDHAERGAR
jgi:hypothetical protein